MLPEIMLREEIELTKKRVSGKDPIYERVRAYITVEGDDTQDYQVACRFNELQVKSLKNGEKRLDPTQLGVLVYGRNLLGPDGSVNPLVKQALLCSRTHLVEKKTLRTAETITEDEIQALEEKFLGKDLPDGELWEWNGYCYQHMQNADERSYEHPNRALLIRRYLAEVNEEIGEYNRGVLKEWKTDAMKYD